MRKFIIFALSAMILFSQCASSGGQSQKETDVPKVKNVILMIGDGMGLSQMYAGFTANKGSLHLERCTHIGLSKTYSADNYVTDSGAGGTAIACGVKTKNGVIGLDANGNAAKSMLEYAAENGLSTGIVVSCDATHATPASFIAHQPKRSMEAEIAADYLKTDFTVFIGGGRKNFEERKDGDNLVTKLKAKNYQVTYTLDDAKKVTSGKLMGFVADKHPAAYPERGEMLPEGVATAINILKQNEKGFFLMVEGSQIDWACHNNDQKALENEMLDFDRSIKVALDFAAKEPGTLVIITADHETGGVATNDGNLSSGELNAAFTTTGHSGVMVPIYAFGTGAELFTGIQENTGFLDKVLKLYQISKK